MTEIKQELVAGDRTMTGMAPGARKWVLMAQDDWSAGVMAHDLGREPPTESGRDPTTA